MENRYLNQTTKPSFPLTRENSGVVVADAAAGTMFFASVRSMVGYFAENLTDGGSP